VADPTDPESSDTVPEAALFEARSDQRNDAPEAEPEPTGSSTVPARRGGWLLAGLALLFSLGAVALSGYLYYLQQVNDPLASVDPRIASVETQASELSTSMDELRSAQSRALEDFARQQRSELEAAKQSLLDSLQQIAGQAPPSSREWKVAEVAYLLRIANHRLLMERDVNGALELLRAADVILAELDDFSFYQVRSNLVEEIRALEAVDSNDLTGIYLELEAMKRELSRLPLKLPEYLEVRSRQTTADAQTAQGFWPTLRTELASKFRIRSFNDEIKPLLSPQEAVYLELNLRLMLERAQLAALRREQLVFSDSLETAADWLTEYLDVSDTQVRGAVDDLREVAQIQLDVDMPDISGSLSALQALRSES